MDHIDDMCELFRFGELYYNLRKSSSSKKGKRVKKKEKKIKIVRLEGRGQLPQNDDTREPQ